LGLRVIRALKASRSLIAVATRSLGAAAEEVTIAQYRALVVLAVTASGRLVVDQATARRRALIGEILGRLPVSRQHAVAEALAAFADAAGEIPDHRWPPGPDGTPADEAVQPSRPHEEAARVPAGPRGRS